MVEMWDYWLVGSLDWRLVALSVPFAVVRMVELMAAEKEMM